MHAPGFEQIEGVDVACAVLEAHDGGAFHPGSYGGVSRGGVAEDALSVAQGEQGGADAAAGLSGFDDAYEVGECGNEGVAGDGGVGKPCGVRGKLAEDGCAALLEGVGDDRGRFVGGDAHGKDDEGGAAGCEGGFVGGGVDAGCAAADDGDAMGREEGGASFGEAQAACGGLTGADDGGHGLVEQRDGPLQEEERRGLVFEGGLERHGVFGGGDGDGQGSGCLGHVEQLPGPAAMDVVVVIERGGESCCAGGQDVKPLAGRHGAELIKGDAGGRGRGEQAVNRDGANAGNLHEGE